MNAAGKAWDGSGHTGRHKTVGHVSPTASTFILGNMVGPGAITWESYVIFLLKTKESHLHGVNL